MPHPCHRCGTDVPDGSPFCAQCGAPQIRVATEPNDAPATPPQLPFHGISERPRVVWSWALPRAVGAAIAMAIIASRATNAFLLVLIMVLGGVLAVWLYSLKPDVRLVTGSMGARIGVVTGFIAALCVGIVSAIALATDRAAMLDQVKKGIEQQVAQNPNPQAQQMMKNVLSSPESLMGLLVLAGALMFFLFLIFSAVGGALGAAIVRKK